MARATRVVVCLAFIALALFASGAVFHATMQNSGGVAGNGIIEPGEQCDDGNLVDGDGCSATMQIEQQCYDAGNTFSFFSWSDSYNGAGDYGVMQTFADAVNRTRYPTRVIPRFWFAAGDIPYSVQGLGTLDGLNDTISNGSSGPNYPFQCAAANGQFPYFVAVGNHDVDGEGGSTPTPQSQYNYWAGTVGPKLPGTLVGISNFKWGPTKSYDPKTNYSFDYKNAHFVVVNQYDSDPAYPTANPVACSRPSNYNWIDSDLAATTKPIKFVFGHEPAWSYCSNLDGYGGSFCPIGSVDNQNPAYRPRPYSTAGGWNSEPFGLHWGDSLEDPSCDAGSRESFWAMLGRHNVVAHIVGHSHTYSGRLVQGDGTRRNDVPAYSKTGQTFDVRDGIWEVNTGIVHSSDGALYVLTTVRDNVVTFESFDQIGTETFKKIESWSVHVGTAPTVAIAGPATGATFSLPASIPIDITGSDPDGSLTRVTLSANSTVLATYGGAPNTFTWLNPAPGTYQLTATATDNDNLSTTSAPVTITVNPQNDDQAPVLAPIGNKTVDELTALTFTAVATDADASDSITYSLVNAPAGATINGTTGAFSWTPTEAQGPGSFRFTVRAKDNHTPYSMTADETIVVTVNEVNAAPTITAIGNKTVNELAALTFTATATDSDLPANGLTFSLVGAPAGASISPTGVFTWTPTEAQGPGTYSFSVRVTDTGTPVASADAPVTVTVNEVNVAPVVATISNKTVVTQSLLTFTVTATDADLPANTLTYGLTNPPAGASIDPTTGVFSWTPTTAQVGTYTVTATATDNGTPVLAGSKSFTITVQGAPDLVVSALSTTTTVLAPGATLSASNTVLNQGPSSAGAFVIAFALSLDNQYGNPDDVAMTTTRSVTSLASTKTSAASTTLTVPSTIPLGTYYLCAKVDSANAVTESNEANNTLCTTTTLVVGRPDLVISQPVPGSSDIVAGGTLTSTDTATNSGTLGSSSFTIAYRLSKNTVYGDPDDITISTTRTATLAAGASSTATTTLTLPSSLTTGPYYLCAKADSANTNVERDENNNTACSATTVTVQPADLVVSAISTATVNVAPGATLSLSNSVRNNGGVSAGSSTVGFHLSQDAVYGGADDIAFTTTRTVSSLAAAATNTASTTLTVPATTATGNYYVCATADSANTIAEGSETNNSACTATTVHVEPTDLVALAPVPASGSAQAGGTLTISDTVTNPSPTPATTFTVAYRLSLNAIYGDPDDVTISTTRSVSSIAAGGQSQANVSLAIASSTPPGTYFVCEKADSTNTQAESNENNNTACSSTTVIVGPPDLVVTLVSPTPAAVLPGGTVTVSNSVANQGGSTASSNFVQAFHLSVDATYGGSDDIVLSATRNISSLTAGATNNASTSVTVPSTTALGSYYVCVMTDSTTKVTESNETNNTACSAAPIQVSRPDLVVSSVVPAAPGVAPGGSLSTTDTVANNGAIAAASFTVAYRLSSNTTYGDPDDITLTATRTISSLNPSASNTATTTLAIPASVAAGTYYVCAKADSASVVTEGNENNNTACSSAIAVGLADLTVSSVVPGANTVAPGGSLSETDTVANNGAIAAASFTVDYRLSSNTTYGDPDDITLTATRTISSLNPSASNTATTTLAIPASVTAGTYYVCAKADSASAVTESNENNNAACSSAITIGLADLTVSSVAPGAGAVAPGGVLSISDTVANGGLVGAGPFSVSYRLSPNAIAGDGDDIALAETRSIASLGAQGSNPGSTNVTVPPSANGTYFVCAIADLANAVAESSEVNNGLCSGSVQVGLADLAVTAVGPTPDVSLVAPGSAFTLSDTVANSGVLRADTFVVAYRLSLNATVGDPDDVPLAETRIVGSLDPSGTSTVITSVVVPANTAAGSYLVCAIADSTAAVAEANETNNAACSTTVVTVTGN